jgi:hypothetical protein
LGVVFVFLMRLSTTSFILFFSLGLEAMAWASDLAVNPYRGITERNAFHLRAPLPDTPKEPVKVAPPIVTLTGITTILEHKIVFITIAAAKPGQLPESVMLGVGQVFKEIEVRSIDEQTGVVKIVNHGELQSLDMNDAGAKSSDYFKEPVLSQPVPKLNFTESDAGRLRPEERVALIEIQRIKMQEESDPTSKILPPTELTAEILGQ